MIIWTSIKSVVRFLWYVPRIFLIGLIWVYQKTLSPDHGLLRVFFPGGYCKYTPCCSDYGKAVIKRYGVVRGSGKALWRIVRCNPWSKGGVDLPEKK